MVKSKQTRVKYASAPDTAQYFVLHRPYPPHAQADVPADAARVAAFLRAALGSRSGLRATALYGKPDSGSMLVAALEFDLEHGKADDDAAHVLLGAHAWPAVLASPQPEYVGAATRVFRCVLGSDAALARGGWRRVDLGTPTALGDHEMDGRTGEFVALWPRPAWCAPPSEDATRAPLCRPLRRSDFADVGVLAAASAHADAQEPVVVGSAACARAKASSAQLSAAAPAAGARRSGGKKHGRVDGRIGGGVMLGLTPADAVLAARNSDQAVAASNPDGASEHGLTQPGLALAGGHATHSPGSHELLLKALQQAWTHDTTPPVYPPAQDATVDWGERSNTTGLPHTRDVVVRMTSLPVAQTSDITCDDADWGGVSSFVDQALPPITPPPLVAPACARHARKAQPSLCVDCCRLRGRFVAKQKGALSAGAAPFVPGAPIQYGEAVPTPGCAPPGVHQSGPPRQLAYSEVFSGPVDLPVDLAKPTATAMSSFTTPPQHTSAVGRPQGTVTLSPATQETASAMPDELTHPAALRRTGAAHADVLHTPVQLTCDRPLAMHTLFPLSYPPLRMVPSYGVLPPLGSPSPHGVLPSLGLLPPSLGILPPPPDMRRVSAWAGAVADYEFAGSEPGLSSPGSALGKFDCDGTSSVGGYTDCDDPLCELGTSSFPDELGSHRSWSPARSDSPISPHVERAIMRRSLSV